MIRIGMTVAALVAVAILVLFAWALVEHRLHGEVTAESLAHSVADEAGSAGELLGEKATCTPDRRIWRCEMIDGGGSGGVEYDVRVRPGSSCWDAKLHRVYGEPMPWRVDGCVRVAD